MSSVHSSLSLTLPKNCKSDGVLPVREEMVRDVLAHFMMAGSWWTTAVLLAIAAWGSGDGGFCVLPWLWPAILGDYEDCLADFARVRACRGAGAVVRVGDVMR
jgi:hypothetical protein